MMPFPLAALLTVASASPPEARPKAPPRIADDPFDRDAVSAPWMPRALREPLLASPPPPPVLTVDDHAKIAAAAGKRSRRAAKRLGVTRD